MDSEPPLSKLLSVAPIILLWSVINGSILFAIFLVVVLLLTSALISGSEVAFYSLSPEDKEYIKEKYPDLFQQLKELMIAPNRLLATILIANNFINIAIVVISDYIIWNAFSEELFLSWADQLKSSLSFLTLSTASLAGGINLIITLVGVTTLLVLFGEVAPKIYAKINNVKFVKRITKPMIFLHKMLAPFSFSFVYLSGIIERRLLGKSMGLASSMDDIDAAIDLAVKEEGDTDQKASILKAILNFNHVTAKQIMRSRMDVVTLDVEDDFEHVLQTIRSSGHSRIPVERDDFDHISGILYVKDLLMYLDEPKNFQWQSVINTEVLYIPETKKINELLKIFQEKHMHMAIVVDEYGGSAGIVTLEDVMEEVIGEIRDEFDQSETIGYKKIDEHTYVFEGKALINDVCRVMDIDVEEFDDLRGESDTIAGLILEKAGIIPKKNFSFINQNQYKFTVVGVSKKRIEKVKLQRLIAG